MSSSTEIAVGADCPSRKQATPISLQETTERQGSQASLDFRQLMPFEGISEVHKDGTESAGTASQDNPSGREQQHAQRLGADRCESDGGKENPPKVPTAATECSDKAEGEHCGV